jgi:hypothetical protein
MPTLDEVPLSERSKIDALRRVVRWWVRVELENRLARLDDQACNMAYFNALCWSRE